MAVSDLGKGVTIEFKGELFTVVEYSHTFKGRGKATVQTKLKNVVNGKVIPHNFSESDDFKLIRLEEKWIKYLYSTGGEYHFMDNQTFEQLSLNKDQIGEMKNFMLDGIEMSGFFHNDQVVKVELPMTVELKVIETDPGVKGDTVSGGDKPAKLESGAEIKVPLFIKVGDVLKVDTREGGRYLERAK
jgi:elongation factor P